MKRKTIIVTIIIMLTAGMIHSQYYFFGKNKVRQTRFEWKILETEHFKVYYYTTDNIRLIKKIAQSAEQTYDRLSKFLNVQVEKKVPILFYRNHIEFEQTNLYPGFLPPAAQAFAEPIGHRVVVQGDSSEEQLLGTLTHELGHIFEYAVWYQNVARSALAFRTPPMWVVEGFADFITEGWDAFNLLTVRDAVLNDQIPVLLENGQLFSSYGTNRAAYDFGHLAIDFIHHKFGDRGVRTLLYSSRRGGLLPGKKNIAKLFGLSTKMFNYEFKKYARDRFRPFFFKENPEDYSFMIGPDFPFVYSFSHQVSPTGEMLAVITGNLKVRDLDIVLISLKDGKTIKNITPGLSSGYDAINLKFDPSDGRSFAWDRPGEKIAFFVRRELGNYLLLVDILTGKVVRDIKIRRPQDPTSPTFHPDNKRLFFTGIEDTKSYVYSINLDTEETVRLTEGRLYIRAIDLSPDGEKMVFSAQKNGFYKIFLGTLDKPELAVRLTQGECNDITPVFSTDGKRIYYSSDELESYNIYAVDLDEKMLYRYSDVRTGIFFPTQIPGKDQIVVSAYHKNAFYLFKKQVEETLEQRRIEFSEFEYPETESGKAPEVDILSHEKYKPFSKLFLTSLPPVTLGYSTDGSFLASTQLHITDLLGDHNFLLSAASYYGYTNVHLYYLNMVNRLQYFGHLYYYKEPYYYSYNPIDAASGVLPAYFTLRTMFGGDLGLYYPFSRAYRAELGLSLYKQKENSDYFFYGADLPYGQFFDGYAAPVSLSLVGDDIRFAGYGPNRGHTFKLTFSKFFKLGDSFMNAYSITGDFRKYFRIDNNTLFAFRLKGYTSGGDNPLIFYTGGNNTIRASAWRRLVGNRGFHFTAEFRFPLISTARTVLGNVGPLRGVLFFDVGGMWFTEDPTYRFLEEGKFRLQDGISSYGIGLQAFLFGVPLHLEWIHKWDFSDNEYFGFNFWIGFDF